MSMVREIVTIKGNRKIWRKFVNKLRMEGKTVWEVIEPFIKKYGQKK